MTTGVSYSYYFLQLIPQISDGRKYLKTFSLYYYSRIFCHVSIASSYIYFTFVKTLMTNQIEGYFPYFPVSHLENVEIPSADQIIEFGEENDQDDSTENCQYPSNYLDS